MEAGHTRYLEEEVRQLLEALKRRISHYTPHSCRCFNKYFPLTFLKSYSDLIAIKLNGSGLILG